MGALQVLPFSEQDTLTGQLTRRPEIGAAGLSYRLSMALFRAEGVVMLWAPLKGELSAKLTEGLE